MDNVVKALERMLSYYKVKNVAELSSSIHTSQATISSWKARNSLNAVKKKCRELEILEDIFTENVNINENVLEEEIGCLYEILIDNAIYSVKEKLYKHLDSSYLEKIYTFISKNILIKVLKNLSNEHKSYSVINSKEFLLTEIKNTEIKFHEKYKLQVLLNIIEKNLSNLECYVLITKYKEIFNKD